MKTRFLVAAVLMLTASGARALTLPQVTTQLLSNATTSSIILRGVVVAGGAATTAYFRWGTDTTVPNNAGTVTGMPASGTNYSMAATLTGLLEGTRYFWELVASNSYGVVTGAVENGVTTQTGYAPEAGVGFSNIDPTRPYGSEPSSVWPQAERQTRYQIFDLLSLLGFGPDGSWEAGIVTTADLADGAVTQAKIGTGAVGTDQIANGSVTQAKLTGLTTTIQLLAYYDTATPVYIPVSYTDLVGNYFTNLYSVAVPANSFNHLLVTAEVQANSGLSNILATTFVSLKLSCPDGQAPFASSSLNPTSDVYLAMSHLSATNLNGGTITLYGYSEKHNITFGVQSLRIWGVQ